MLHKHCKTDVLGVLLIYPHSPSGAACPQDCVHISVKALAAMLQPINILYCDCITYCIVFIHVYILHKVKSKDKILNL